MSTKKIFVHLYNFFFSYYRRQKIKKITGLNQYRPYNGSLLTLK